jgi:acetylornithine deacetylase/succinyl-diaminopimelate desuccinylase-like protein
MSTITESIFERPEELLQSLIRFDTTNPPGNEAACIDYIDGVLTQAGFETTRLAKDSMRPNLIARLKGRGEAPALLLYGHVDVVPTADQDWTHPPFEGEIIDGYVWGRGALDMKGGVAMMLAAFLRAQATGLVPAGDIALAILSDEESAGDYGAKYLVDNHASRFDDIRYAIGEFGGFSLYVGNQKFYPIQIAEKAVCRLEMTLRGPGGHGSLPSHGGAMAKLSDVLRRLDRCRLPVHITPPARRMFLAMASALQFPTSLIVRQLLNPALTDVILNRLGDKGSVFDPLLHNTVNATVVRGGDTINVIPSEITLKMDGRVLPGHSADELITEVQGVVGTDVELEVIRQCDPSPAEPDMGMFSLLANILGKADPDGIPIPLLLSGSSDARLFSQLGIQTYGFIPMNLPPDFKFADTIHAADERIPVDSLRFGADTIFEVLRRYNG